MQEFRWAYIICEFSEDNVREFPINSTVPASKRKYLRMNGKFMLKCLYDYKEKYGVEIIFTNTKEEAEEKAIEIIQQAYEK